jgi:Ca2+-binding RTX toxin-like protein
MSDNDATANTESITQTNNPDTLTITDQTQIQPGDFFDGLLGNDTIVVGAIGPGINQVILFIPPTPTTGFHNYEAVKIQNNSGTTAVVFASTQFGAGLISTSLAVTGTNGGVQFIAIGAASNFSAAAWTFTNWEATDIVAIQGTIGADTVTGSIMNDLINGNDGVDILAGLLGADQLDGGAGTDTLRGGLGKDGLKGGTEADIFDFNVKTESVTGVNRDVIIDFSGFGGELDHIDLAGIDAKKGVAGNQAFKFIGAQKFHHKVGELQVKYDANTDIAIVSGDINGNGKADFQIEVHSLAALVKADFFL